MEAPSKMEASVAAMPFSLLIGQTLYPMIDQLPFVDDAR
jgi:hypothetical protein